VTRTAIVRCLLAPVLLAAPAGSAAALDWAVSLDGGYRTLSSASRSAEAVFDGSTGGATFGGSVRFGLGRSFFVGAAGRVFRKDGERVFVANATSPVFRLGHPLEVRLVPIYGLVGYRLPTAGILVPYAGVGAGVTLFRERSTVAGETDEASQSKASAHLFAGLDVGRGAVRFGLEVGWSTVPSSIGVGGVSAVYGESNLGGFTVLGRVIFSRPRR
jgi:opacity protein-like surface antigen